MTKKDFTNDSNINNLFKTIEEATEETTKEEIIPEVKEEVKETKQEQSKEEAKTKKKKSEETTKKSQIFSEVNQIVCDYLNLKSFITQKSKREILEEMFFEDIRKTFNLNSKASEDEMKKAIDKKMKQFEEMKILFR